MSLVSTIGNAMGIGTEPCPKEQARLQKKALRKTQRQQTAAQLRDTQEALRVSELQRVHELDKQDLRQRLLASEEARRQDKKRHKLKRRVLELEVTARSDKKQELRPEVALWAGALVERAQRAEQRAAYLARLLHDIDWRLLGGDRRGASYLVQCGLATLAGS
jgi:hypothetical protein